MSKRCSENFENEEEPAAKKLKIQHVTSWILNDTSNPQQYDIEMAGVESSISIFSIGSDDDGFMAYHGF